jgi:hypothetical protein
VGLVGGLYLFVDGVESIRSRVFRLVDFLHGVRQFLDVVEEDSELFEVKRTMARV